MPKLLPRSIADFMAANKALAAILATGLLIRLLYIYVSLIPGNSVQPCEVEIAARSLAERGVLGNIWTPDSGPTAHVSPIYAAWLAALIKVFSWKTTAQLWIQYGAAAAASVLAAFFAARTARLLTNSRVAEAIVAAVLCLIPLGLFDEVNGQFEVSFSKAFLAGLMLHAVTTIHARRFGMSPLKWGIAHGAILLLTPSLILASFALQFFATAVLEPRKIRVAIDLIGSILVCIVVAAPWIVRNHVELGKAIATRSNFGLELYIGNSDHANGRSLMNLDTDGRPHLYKIHPFGPKIEGEKVKEIGEVAYMNQKLAQSIDWIKRHPTKFAELTLGRFITYWFPDPEFFDGSDAKAWIKSVVSSFLSAACLGWLGIACMRKNRIAQCALLTILLCSLPYLITHVNSRYRSITTPVVTAFAVVGLFAAMTYRRRPQTTVQSS